MATILFYVPINDAQVFKLSMSLTIFLAFCCGVVMNSGRPNKDNVASYCGLFFFLTFNFFWEVVHACNNVCMENRGQFVSFNFSPVEANISPVEPSLIHHCVSDLHFSNG